MAVETTGLIQSIEMYSENDGDYLRMAASVIAGYEDFTSPKLWGILSFEKEAELGAYITNREPDIVSEENYVVRTYMPVVRGEQTVAMLYGVIELNGLPEELKAKPYGGRDAIYIIDGSSGDFLVDTWHNDISGNIWALGERKMAPGYTSDQLKQGVMEGREGYVAFASANSIKTALNVFLDFEALCFIAYFIWMLRYVKRETSEKQRRLDMLNDIYEIERLLFNAHEKGKNIALALERIGHIVSADYVGLWLIGPEQNGLSFVWTEDGENELKEPEEKQTAGRVLKYFSQGPKQIEEYGSEIFTKQMPGKEIGRRRDLMAVPVGDMDGNVCGAPQASRPIGPCDKMPPCEQAPMRLFAI